jgi:hypothetical protein
VLQATEQRWHRLRRSAARERQSRCSATALTEQLSHQFVAAEQLLGCCFARVPRNVQQEPIAQPTKARRTPLILRDKTGSIDQRFAADSPPAAFRLGRMQRILKNAPKHE